MYQKTNLNHLMREHWFVGGGCQSIFVRKWPFMSTLRWRHNERNGVSNHQSHHCLLNRLFRRSSKKTLKLHVTGLCTGNSPVTGEFPVQMASNAENVSIWWRYHDLHDKPRRFHYRVYMHYSYQSIMGSDVYSRLRAVSNYLVISPI